MFRLFLFLTFILRATAQETIFRETLDPVTDTHVEVLALFTKPSPGGYFPVRVKISNNLKAEHRVQLNFTSSMSYEEDLRATSAFNFTCPGGKTVTRDILVPLCPSREYGGNTNVITKLSGSMGKGNHNINAGHEDNQPAVLLSEALFTPSASALDSEMSSALGSSRSGSTQFAAKFDPKQLPDNWLAFSGYDSVVLTADDWASIPPGARNAILSWIRLGGQLLVYSSSPVSLSSLGMPAESGYGSISRETIIPSTELAKQMVKCVRDHFNKPHHTAQLNHYQVSWPLRSIFGAQTSHYAFFVIIMLGFGILVGPVNLFVFAKAGKRHRLFITTPLISLAASLLLIATILLVDGFGGNGVRRVLMEVRADGEVNAAYIHQEQFCRTGVLTTNDFNLETPGYFLPVAIEASRLSRFTRNSSQKGNFNLQPADGKILASGDWFQSRSEHGHSLSAVVSTRGRIETTAAAGSLVSTFDFPIDTLYFLDDSKQWQRADNITVGKTFTLSPVEEDLVLPALKVETDGFTERNREMLIRAQSRPGHFVAISRQAPGLATHPGIKWRETHTVLTGPVVAP
jgi:hypothetical protein